ncbi:MAG: response regulator transcription factor [Mariprofundaceae bacterium]|nr:response regulator transcription factor [Mariprofundaceae bacterium]
MNRKIRVLIVDDEPHIRKMVSLVMEQLKTEVVGMARDGEQGVEMFRELKPDLVLMDVNMPRMKGTEALKLMHEASPNTPIIMLTSLVATDVVVECLDAGARNYLRKDTPPKEMRTLIRETWNEHVRAKKSKKQDL